MTKRRLIRELAADRAVMLATHDNPVSILLLGKVHDFAKRLLEADIDDDEVIASLRLYIHNVNVNPEHTI